MNTNVPVPNKLITASYQITVNAKRLQLIALSKLTPVNYLFAHAEPITITAQEWQYFFGANNPYREMQRAVSELSSTKFQFEDSRQAVEFIKSSDYKKGQGIINLEINPVFLSHCQ